MVWLGQERKVMREDISGFRKQNRHEKCVLRFLNGNQQEVVTLVGEGSNGTPGRLYTAHGSP